MRSLRGPIAASIGICLALLSSCNPAEAPRLAETGKDIHTFSEPEKVRVKHIDLDLEALFDRKILEGHGHAGRGKGGCIQRAADSGHP